MESSIFFGGSVIAAVVAGMLALFAPCCISFMLPAYFASSFQNRLRLVAMTFLFAAGVATIILPIALGASVMRQLFAAQHAVIYVVGGVLLHGLAIYLLFGGQIHLPMPGRSAGGKAGALTTHTLGVFSGITSSCCAPVLAGVIALSGIAPSFLMALGLGTAYVFGMVAPLFVISLLAGIISFPASFVEYASFGVAVLVVIPLLAALTAPLVAIAAVAVLYDLRLRREGFASLASEAVGGEPEPTPV